MRRFRGRGASHALFRTSGLRHIERLESRCVLNGGPLGYSQMAAPMAFGGGKDYGAMPEPQQHAMLASPFGGQQRMADFGDPMMSPSRGFGPESYGFDASPMMGVPGYGGYSSMQSVMYSTYGGVFSAPSEEFIIIYNVPSEITSSMNPAVSVPQGLAGLSVHADVPIVGNTKLNVNASIDAPQHLAPLSLPGQIQVAVTSHTAGSADLTTSITAHNSSLTIGSAASGLATSAVLSTVVSMTHAFPLLDGAASVWAQSIASSQLPEAIVNLGTTSNHVVTQIVAAINNGEPLQHLANIVSKNLHLANAASEMPVSKASLVNIPFDITGIRHALNTVMTEMESLGVEVTHWLDDMHLTPMITAISAATLGAGTAYYLHRRREEEASRREEEASSSWLFARLHAHSD